MEIQGKVFALLPEFRTQSGKVKNGFVLETSGQYPQRIPFDVWGERWASMGVAVGANVSVSFDIAGREFNGKYFVNLSAWKIVRLDGAESAAPAAQVQAPAPEPSPAPAPQQKKDDLPF